MKNWIIILTALVLAVPAFAHEETAANEMALAARNLIATLTAEQKAASVYAMDHDHRLDWHFVPKERKGTTLKEMNPEQRLLTTALLAASLSGQGLMKATSIMSLEQVLQVLEGPNRRFPRDPEMYHISVFGDPAPGATWGWRFEGHHLSLSFTIVNLHLTVLQKVGIEREKFGDSTGTIAGV
jgi:hypothetical protein